MTWNRKEFDRKLKMSYTGNNANRHDKACGWRNATYIRIKFVNKEPLDKQLQVRGQKRNCPKHCHSPELNRAYKIQNLFQLFPYSHRKWSNNTVTSEFNLNSKKKTENRKLRYPDEESWLVNIKNANWIFKFSLRQMIEHLTCCGSWWVQLQSRCLNPH